MLKPRAWSVCIVRRLIGAIGGPEDVDIDMVAALAADAFLTHYGVDEEKRLKRPRNPISPRDRRVG